VTSPPQCPCGQAHELSAGARRAYDEVARGLPATVLVSGGGRAWLVPRVFIAAHGLPAAGLPELAARYGFTEGTT
jgi:hypothetical protein